MAKLAELCRKVPVAVKQSQIWGMIEQTYDIERIARHEQKQEKRCNVHRDAVAVCSTRRENIFAAGKENRPNRRRCTAHVSTGSVSDTIVTKRFGNSRLTCVCRTKIY